MGINDTHFRSVKDIQAQAQMLLTIFQESSEYEAIKRADDFLTYFYTLRDHYRIRRLPKAGLPQGSIVNLNDVIYQLESRPEEIFQRNDLMDFISGVLRDIISGRIEISPKP